MEIRPTAEEIAKARAVAYGATEDRYFEDSAKPIRGDLQRIADAWARLSEDTKAQIELRLDRDRDGWPDIGRAIEETIQEFGAAEAHRPDALPGLRKVVASLWASYKARAPRAGGGKWSRGQKPYPALRFVAAGVRAIWPERYDAKDDILFTETHSQLNLIIYPPKSTPKSG